MQSKPSKNRNGRSANAAEKAFQGWVKYKPCCWCGSESGSIVDHCRGSKWGHLKVHCGHWFVIPQCLQCDHKKTIEGKKLGDYAAKWAELISSYETETGKSAPIEVHHSISDWGSTWKNGRL